MREPMNGEVRSLTGDRRFSAVKGGTLELDLRFLDFRFNSFVFRKCTEEKNHTFTIIPYSYHTFKI